MANVSSLNWGLQFNRGYQGPLDVHSYFPTLEAANEYLITYATSNVWEGQTISVGTGDSVALYIVKKNAEGAWFLEESGGAIKKFENSADLLAFAVAKNVGKVAYLVSVSQDEKSYSPGLYVVTGESTVSKVDVGPLSVKDYSSALAEIKVDNIGQIIYVTTDETIYKYMDGETEKTFSSSSAASFEEDFVDGKAVFVYYDAEDNILFESKNATESTLYAAGPYIVTGAQSLAKLGTTSASGDLAGDVSNLQGRVGTLETETIKDVEVGESSGLDGINSGTVKKFATASVSARKATLTPVIGKLTQSGGVENEGLATVTNVKNYVDEVFAWEEVETVATTTPAPDVPGQ